MSWHEPGRDRDPWRGPGEGPPDLDEWLRRARRRIAGWFGRAPHPSGERRLNLWWVVPPVLIGIWLLTGFYQVPAAHQAVTLRFGAYTDTTGPGLHWHWPWPVAEVRMVDMSENRSLSQHADVITHDGKLVTLGVTVAYRISDPVRYLFGSAQPTGLVSALADDALTTAARKEDLAALEGNGLDAVEKSLKDRVRAALAAAGAGIEVQSVSIGNVVLPAAVTASRQKLDQIRKQNEANAKKAADTAAQAMDETRTKAHGLIVAAQRQAASREARARARAARFQALLPEWRKSPETVREALREEAVSGVLAVVPKIVVSGPIKVLKLPVLSATTATTKGAAKATAKAGVKATAAAPAAVSAAPGGTGG